MKKIVFSLLLSLFALSLTIQAYELTPKQIEVLKMVKSVAKRYKDNKGESFEYTAMAICLSETSAGVFRIGDIGKIPNIFKASLGIMQVRLQTARFVAKKMNLRDISKMSDVELVNRLLSDDGFNVYVAVKYIIWLSDYTKNYFRTVSRYNGGNNNRTYYYKVMKNMRLIKGISALRD